MWVTSIKSNPPLSFQIALSFSLIIMKPKDLPSNLLTRHFFQGWHKFSWINGSMVNFGNNLFSFSNSNFIAFSCNKFLSPHCTEGHPMTFFLKETLVSPPSTHMEVLGGTVGSKRFSITFWGSITVSFFFFISYYWN